MRKLESACWVWRNGKRHAENLRRNVSEAHLIAVADVSEDRARQTALELEIEHGYSSLEAMLENKKIEAVVIATPDKFHARRGRTRCRGR